jgi:tetratricopeptide (TPR) repeat protein
MDDPEAIRRPDGREMERQIAEVERGLCLAAYQLGDLQEARRHGLACLARSGVHVPDTMIGWGGALLGELLRATVASLPGTGRGAGRPDEGWQRIVDVLLPVTESFFYSGDAPQIAWSALRMVRAAAPHGPSARLAHGHMLVGLLLGFTPAGNLGWRRRALAVQMIEDHGSPSDVCRAKNRVAVFYVGLHRWDDARRHLEEALAVAKAHGDRRMWEESQAILGVAAFYPGRLDESEAAYQAAFDLARQSGNRQVQGWAQLGRGDCEMLRGAWSEATAHYDLALALLHEEVNRTERFWAQGMYALAALHLGRPVEAWATARRALDSMRGRLPAGYWMQQGLSGIAEVVLRVDDAVAPATERAQVLTRTMRMFGTFQLTFPHARPAYLLWSGVAHARRGALRRGRRRLRDAIAAADRSDMPHEGAMARTELAAIEAGRGARLETEGHGRFARLGRRVPYLPVLRDSGSPQLEDHGD